MITFEEYKTRRQQLARQLNPGSVALIPAAAESIRNADTHYRFRQQSNFYYLTGYNEPDALLLIHGGEQDHCILFNRSRNPAEEQWTGKRLGQEGAIQELGMHNAFPLEELSAQLPQLFADKACIYFPFGGNLELEQHIRQALSAMKAMVRRGIQAPNSLVDLDPILSEMRLIKSPAELKLMQQAADISVAALLRALRQCKHVRYEYELEAELRHEFMRRGCRDVAYDPIVGGGENACILHYTDNNCLLRDGDLVLIDAGGEYQNYAADITRTFPVNGRFTPEQKSIYELVLRAQQAGIAKIQPGVQWHEVQKIIIQILTEGLCALGIIEGNVDELIEQQAYRPFYMHNSGHWLGLDVHDVGVYKVAGEWRPFAAGMVLTVEPGLYISPNTMGVDKRWWGIGVRIEDDVVVTATGHEVLTKALPVEIADIEALMCE